MNRTFKLIASRGSEVIFDDRIEAATPREARNILKERLGLASLSGIVYSITEIPVELIREIVDALLSERLQPILKQLAALEGTAQPIAPQPEDPAPEPEEPNWDLVRRHFRRYGDPAKTAEKYGVSLDSLTARAGEEGWAI